MPNIQKLIARPFLAAAVFFLLSTTTISLMWFSTFTGHNQRRARLARRAAASQVYKIEQAIQKHLSTVQAMATFISYDTAISPADFNFYANMLLQDEDGTAASMAYSPGFKIQMIWPQNKATALAKNKVLTERTGREHYLKVSADTKKAFVEGPTNFAHLDSALCLFVPVYANECKRNANAMQMHRKTTDNGVTESPHKGQGRTRGGINNHRPVARPLGVVDIVLRWNRLADATGLTNLARELKVAIRGKDGTGGLGDVFFGDEETFGAKDAITLPIKLPMGEWQLAIADIPMPIGAFAPNLYIALLGAALLLSIIIYLFLGYLQRYITGLEGKYSRAIKASGGMMWAVDYKTLRYTHASDNCKMHTGYTPAEYLKMVVPQICTAETVAKATTELEQAAADMKTGRTKAMERTFEMQQNTKWGTQIWTKTSVTAVLDKQGEVAELIGISRLITEERRLENAFNEMIRRQQLIAKYSGEAMWLLDTEALACIFISESTLNVTGYTPRDMLGRFLYDFMPPAQYEMLLTHFEYNSSSLMFNISTAEPKALAIELYKKGAEPILCEMTIDAALDGNGAVREFVVNVRESKLGKN